MIIETKFDFGEMVVLKTDKEKKPRMITGFISRLHGNLFYLSCETAETCHYEIEFETITNDTKTVTGFANGK